MNTRETNFKNIKYTRYDDNGITRYGATDNEGFHPIPPCDVPLEAKSILNNLLDA